MSFFDLNTGILDIPWTLVHIVVPFILILILSRFVSLRNAFFIALSGVILWELFELTQGPGGFGGSESIVNHVADLFIGLVAIGLGLLVVRNG